MQIYRERNLSSWCVHQLEVDNSTNESAFDTVKHWLDCVVEFLLSLKVGTWTTHVQTLGKLEAADDCTYTYNMFFWNVAGKSKEAEIKRINKELANIRSKFKGKFISVMQNIVKRCYLQLDGTV